MVPTVKLPPCTWRVPPGYAICAWRLVSILWPHWRSYRLGVDAEPIDALKAARQLSLHVGAGASIVFHIGGFQGQMTLTNITSTAGCLETGQGHYHFRQLGGGA